MFVIWNKSYTWAFLVFALGLIPVSTNLVSFLTDDIVICIACWLTDTSMYGLEPCMFTRALLYLIAAYFYCHLSKMPSCVCFVSAIYDDILLTTTIDVWLDSFVYITAPTNQNQVLFFTRGSQILAGSLVLMFTWIKTFRQWFDGRKLNVQLPISRCLLRDGTWYFMYVHRFNLCNSVRLKSA